MKTILLVFLITFVSIKRTNIPIQTILNLNMKKILITLSVVTMLTAGCKTSFNKKVFLAEMAAASTSDASMRGYATYWKSATNNPTAFNRTLEGLHKERAMIESLSIKVGSSIELTEGLRSSYVTNSAVKPALEASLITLSVNASNIIYTVSQQITK